MDEESNRVVSEELKASSETRYKRGSNSTVDIGVSDWETHMKESDFTVSCNPWSWYLACRNAKILTVEPAIFLYMFGTYLFLPLFRQYYFNRFALDRLQNTSYYNLNTTTACLKSSDIDYYTGINGSYKAVEKLANDLSIYFSVVNGIISIIVTLIMGPLSDRYGRRLVIASVGFGAVIQGLSTIAIIHYDLNVYYFILSGAVSGLFGDIATIMMASFSYVSDISSKKWRTVRIGIVQSMIFLAGILAEKLGGLWFERLHCDFVPVLVLFVAVNAAVIVYTVIFTPESLTREQRRRRSYNKPRGIHLLSRGVKIFLCMVKEYPVWQLWLGMIALVIMTFNLTGESTIAVFFFKALDWNPDLIGSNQAVGMSSHLVTLLVIMPTLSYVFKFPDPLLSLIGISFHCGMNLFIGLSTRTYQLFIIAVIQGVEALTVPSIKGAMSKVICSEDQGALFSIVASAETLGGLVAGVVYPIILPLTLEHNLRPGTAYMVMAALGLIPIPLISIILLHWCKKKYCAALNDKESDDVERTPFIADKILDSSDMVSPSVNQ